MPTVGPDPGHGVGYGSAPLGLSWPQTALPGERVAKSVLLASPQEGISSMKVCAGVPWVCFLSPWSFSPSVEVCMRSPHPVFPVCVSQGGRTNPHQMGSICGGRGLTLPGQRLQLLPDVDATTDEREANAVLAAASPPTRGGSRSGGRGWQKRGLGLSVCTLTSEEDKGKSHPGQYFLSD